MGIFSELLEEEQDKNRELREMIKNLENVIRKQEEIIKKQAHEIETTQGLWCTDQPEAIPEDKKDLFFQIGGENE